MAVSGYLGSDEVSNYDFNGVIDKPMGPERLQEVVEAILKQNYNWGILAHPRSLPKAPTTEPYSYYSINR